MHIHALRLQPGQDLKAELHAFVQHRAIQAGCILTAVGSLQKVALRFANQSEAARSEGHFEILSLCGTLSLEGLHLHLAIADPQGSCLGGHLLEGCQISTTAEIIVAEFRDVHFRRPIDPRTGFRELRIDSV